MSRRKTNTLENRAEVLDYLNSVGNMAAAQAAVAVCNDPKATAQAKATASSTILKATALGGFARNFTPPEAVDPEDAYVGLTREELDMIVEYMEARVGDPNTPEPRIRGFSDGDGDDEADADEAGAFA